MLKLTHCELCPRRCGADRTKGVGFCGAGDKLRLAKAMLHEGEEPCLIGQKGGGRYGAGAVFFSGCNLQCVFCQNYEISLEHRGWEVPEERLSEIFLELQEAGAASLDLVTPTPWVSFVAMSLRTLREEKKLQIPVVYNCGGYERTEALRCLEGLVDIYLPDLKYLDPVLSARYSGTEDYFSYASQALLEMYHQVGPAAFSPNGQMEKGLLIRHLVLPGCVEDSVRLMRWLGENFPEGSIRVSLLAQYTPYGDLENYPELRRRITTYEYEKVVKAADEAGLLGYRQFRSSATMELRPAFDGSGLHQNIIAK